MSATFTPIMLPVLVDGKYKDFPVWHKNLARCVARNGENGNFDQKNVKEIFPDTVHMNERTALRVFKCGETERLCRQSYYIHQTYSQTLSAIVVNARKNTVHMIMCIYRLPIPEDVAQMIAKMVGTQREIFFARHTHHHIIDRKRRFIINNTRPEDMVPCP